jgi:signal transduction histidine kinase/DNA-binding response OmpR family regulator
MFGLLGGSISKKLTWMNMLVSGAAVVLACATLFSYDLVTFRQIITRQLSIQAQMIGSNSVSALLFDDPKAAQSTLSALKASPNVVSAGIYRADGQPFAAYWRDRYGDTPSLPPITGGQVQVESSNSGKITLVRRIVIDGKPTGTVYIQSDLGEVDDRLKRYGAIVILVLAASLGAALFVSRRSQGAISDPIVRLSEIARVVSRDKSYSVRATPSGSGDELAVLVDAFNEMLMQIQERDGALQKGRDELEQRVQERTAELEASKKEVEEYSDSILRAKEEVERASKFKDQFLSTMSHELRTPLNAILGFSDLLKDSRYGPLNERQSRFVGHVHTSGRHLLSLINDILDLSKIEAGRLELNFESVGVGNAFAEVLDTLRPLADKKSHTLSQRAENGLNVRADAIRFKQVLMNLVGNAIKFTPDGGNIELVAHSTHNQIRVEVRDTGPGIPGEEQKRIFEAFYRLRHAGKAPEGTGLGLAITQRLVEMHGGELGLESELGHGSCFHFSLPMASAARLRPVQETGFGPRASESLRILVIEDDLAAAQLIESHLISLGSEVVICNQPQRAAEIAAELQPTAITLDLLMKPTNGWEVLVQLKRDSRTANIPVIVITIVDQPATGTILGADEYLVKPVNKADLLAAMERCLGPRALSPARPILVVEDDAPALEVITELLSAQGYSVTTATDGAQARVQVGVTLPDLVILDLLLPKVNGFELLAEWRATPRTADLPVFVLTSKDLSRQEEDYLRSHAEYLFHKQQPWQEALSSQVRRVVAQSQVEKV